MRVFLKGTGFLKTAKTRAKVMDCCIFPSVWDVFSAEPAFLLKDIMIVIYQLNAILMCSGRHKKKKIWRGKVRLIIIYC